ncbi:MAG: Sensory box histidine kinase/response regulator [Rhodanobacteraceae bacterium]|jgi:PAS domain S-box-containing protein|nr:MAG: Sensory box histidine kinase/response regulator [Rhodanobacteraceae bacterium]
MNAEIEQAARGDANHIVRFYDSEEFLVAELADYAADALRAGEAFVTIATPAHFEALCARLYGRGFDADALLAEGRWVQMDCARTLHALLRDGAPDAARFAAAVEAPLAQLCARHGRVRAFGEMVAMQCEAGDYAGAIELERLWNGLFERLPIALLCAYPMTSFDGVRGREAFARICAAHGEVLPAERHAHVDAVPDEAQRTPHAIEPQHVARFYDDDATLLAELTEFALPALVSGGAFVAIATPARQHALRAALCARGIDLDAMTAEGRWIQLDGAQTLAAICRDGAPDHAAFVAAVEKPLAQLCRHHPDVRVFGEMVALQCQAGDYAGAVRLEAFGNELVEKLPVRVFCAYSMASFADPRTRADFTRICAAHDHVLSPAHVVQPADSGNAGLVTMLRQHASALEEEIRRRVKLEKRVKQRERELREKVDVLETLARVGKALIGERDPDTLVRAIVDSAVRFTAARCGGFARRNGSRESVLLSDADRAHFGGMPMDAIAALFHPIFDGGGIVHRGDLLQDAERAWKPRPIRSFLAVPVPSHNGTVIGALFLGHPEAGAFDTRDELILAGIATQATFAIENARLLDASRQWRRDLQRAVAQRTEELRRSELHLETLLAGITDYAIMLLDAEGRILTWNTGGERIFGYGADEILGSHFSRFYTRAEHDEGASQGALRVAREKGTHEIEAWRTRKDGSRFWASAMLMAIRDDDGRVTGYAKVIRDLTEARVAEERLQQAQRMEVVGQLTGGIAHDFNNLLTIILGNIDEVLRLHPDDNAVRTAAERVSGAAERAATLTRQLLAFSRRQALKPVPVNATMLLAGMSDMVQRTLGENVRVRTTFSGNWPCEVDVHQLESAILNLAINARDAMPDGGYLSLDVSNAHLDDAMLGDDRVSGDFVVITVADTGTGMPAEVLERACEPFFTTKPLGRGTGLGLSQVYGFVRQSGGYLTIASEPGTGTTIRIFLPRSHEERIPPASTALPAAMPRGHETVLLVEDEAGVRQYCAALLRELGYTVLEAGDALGALRVLDEHPGVDLLLTDVGLPVMNGGELAKRAQAKRPGLAVLFASGYPRGIVQQRGQLPSDVELLSKPYTRTQLAQRVRALLDAKPPRDDGARVRALLLEDDAALRQTVAQLLLLIGVSVVEAGNLADTRAVIANGPAIDLAIVDMNLGGENGMDAIRELRAKNPELPVIIASGYGDAVQRNAGEGDARTVILPKPYSLSVLKRTIVSLGFELGSEEIASGGWVKKSVSRQQLTKHIEG